MKNLIFLTLSLIVFSSCVNHQKLIDARKGTPYVVDRAAYGDVTIMRDYNYRHFYYVIQYTRHAQLVPADQILIKDIWSCVKDFCGAKLNSNYLSYIDVKVLYSTQDRQKAYLKFHEITGAPIKQTR